MRNVLIKLGLFESEDENWRVLAVLAHLRASQPQYRKPTVRVEGANLQVVSGPGATSGTVNGTGNLVVGYDEGTGSQTGSHNLPAGP